VWDLDWAFERTLATLEIDGSPRRTVTTAGKLGIFDTLDAATGKYLFSVDSGLQTLVTAIDPKTGDKQVDPKFTPEPNVEKLICTSAIGGRNYPATAFNPGTGILYVPLNEACMNFEWTPGGPFDVRIPTRPRPESDGNIGRIQAIDLANHKTLWTRRQRAPESSAMLATAGGLIFEGSRDRMFRALDDRTGTVLWQTPLDGAPDAFPITFSAGGVQYVAITTGGGGPLDGGLATLAPEFSTPAAGTTLWVFRLAK
jgi:alcohol dehydrogenase (cytochrome c)